MEGFHQRYVEVLVHRPYVRKPDVSRGDQYSPGAHKCTFQRGIMLIREVFIGLSQSVVLDNEFGVFKNHIKHLEEVPPSRARTPLERCEVWRRSQLTLDGVGVSLIVRLVQPENAPVALSGGLGWASGPSGVVSLGEA